MSRVWSAARALWGDAMKAPRQDAKTLYQEVTDDNATWIDAVFWMVIGSVLSGVVQAGIQLAIERYAK